MNRRMLRNAVITLSIVTLSVLATIAVVTTIVRSGPPPSPIGRVDKTLAAGVHILDLVALDTDGTGPARLPKISITLPNGWRSHKGFVVLKFHGGKEVMALSFWDVNLVYPTPCRWESRPMVWPGATVASLASTLAKQPLRNATSPTSTALAGFRGRYVRLSVPKNIDFARCDQGYFESWTGLGWSTDRYEQGPGQVDRLWILDVEGQRLVVDATYLPAATANDRAELDRVVHSIKFLSVSPQKPTSEASGGFAASARSAHTERFVHFVLPGGDTECQMLDPNRLDGYLECAIHRNRNRCPGHCDVEWEASRRWTVDVTRIASVERDERPLGAGDRARVLRSGQASRVGFFRCTSRDAGLTCVSRHSGHGFFLSENNESQRLF
jgi:hypothetical protein